MHVNVKHVNSQLHMHLDSVDVDLAGRTFLSGAFSAQHASLKLDHVSRRESDIGR